MAPICSRVLLQITVAKDLMLSGFMSSRPVDLFVFDPSSTITVESLDIRISGTDISSVLLVVPICIIF